MSDLVQAVIVGVLVLAAAGYATWRLGPSALRRRFGRGGSAAGGGCSSCEASGPLPRSRARK